MVEKTNHFLSLKQVTIRDPFFSPVQNTVIHTMIPYQEKVLHDEIPDIRPSHVIRNYRIAAGEIEGTYYGRVFQDSDLAKWLEAVAYSLTVQPDAELEARADEIIDLIGRVQKPDGYLDTYFIVAEPEMRWKDLGDCHEMYCDGRRVPDILLSGHHVNVEKWRREQSLIRTRERRPDLIPTATLTEEDQKFLRKLEEKQI